MRDFSHFPFMEINGFWTKKGPVKKGLEKVHFERGQVHEIELHERYSMWAPKSDRFGSRIR